MHSFLQDVRCALRRLRKNPGYALIAILALAVGIGANSTIFVSLNAMLLRPLPFRQLDPIVAIWTTVPALSEYHDSMTPADFRAFRDQSSAFEAIDAALRTWRSKPN